MNNQQQENQLLACLVLYTKLYHKPFTAEALVANLPVEKDKTFPELFSLTNSKSLFSRAAVQAGLKTKIAKRSLNEISNVVLPAILILKNNKALILEHIDKEAKQAQIISPELSGDLINTISLETLQSEYSGFVFYLKQEYNYHTRRHDLVKNTDKHWFWGTIKLSKSIYIDAIIASFVINLFVLATPLFTMNVYDRVVPNNAIDTMWVLIIGISVAYIFDGIVKYQRAHFLEVASKKNDIIMSSKIFEKVLNLRMGSQKSTVGNLANTIRDFDSVKSFFSNTTLAVFIDIPFIFIFLTTIFLLGGAIVFVPILMSMLLIGYSFYIRKPLKEALSASAEASNNKNSVLIESLVNIETIKTLGAQGHAQWAWEESIGEIASKSIKSKSISTSISIINGFLTQFTTVAIIAAGVFMINDKTLTQGALIAIVMIAGRVIGPIGQIASLIINYETTKLAYDGINKLMDLPTEREAGKEYIFRPVIDGDIEFKNVSFKYSEDANKALDNISFIIKKGEKIGILGKIGSGKTTINKLLLGIYQPTEGSILIDGIDIAQIDPADLRSRVSYVSQDIVMFQGTVKENIVYRSFGADNTAILKVARLACVDDFVRKHPKGYDLPIGELGIGLSGGQKQSIAIARAFLKDSPIILMDEPTSMMDNTTENNIKRNLKEYCKDKTLILGTHKTSLLYLVDKLMILDDGKIAAFGEKNEVLQKFMK